MRRRATESEENQKKRDKSGMIRVGVIAVLGDELLFPV